LLLFPVSLLTNHHSRMSDVVRQHLSADASNHAVDALSRKSRQTRGGSSQ